MKPLLHFVWLTLATLIAACATRDGEAPTVASPPPAVGAGTTAASVPVAAQPAAPAPVTSAAAPETGGPAAPSLKETARLQKELGNQVIPYPFNNCAVIQRPFDREGPKHRRIYKGYEVLFCCTPCVRAFDANPEPYMPRIIAAAKEKSTLATPAPVAAP